MTKIKVSFWGLCYLVHRDAIPKYEVYLPIAKNHVGTMAIPVDHIDTETITWTPDAIVHQGKIQLASWKLSGRVTFSASPSTAGKTPEWDEDDRMKSIHFGIYHPGNLAKLETDLVDKLKLASVVLLTGGELESGDREDFEVTVGTVKAKQDKIARYIEWAVEADTLTISNGKDTVTTKKKDLWDDDRTVAVTNVSTNKPTAGTDHLDLYYDLLTATVAAGKKVTIKKKGHHLATPGPHETHGSHETHRPDEARGAHTYDCVPPGTGS